MDEASKEKLRKYLSKKSIYITLPEGVEVTVRFLGFEEVVTNFKGTPTESIRFQFEHDGLNKSLDRTSRDFITQMGAFKFGDWLTIKRTGQRNNTRYVIKPLE